MQTDSLTTPSAAPSKRDEPFVINGRVIVADATKFEIPDLRLLALFEPLPQNASAELQLERQSAMVSHITEVVDFIDRVVEGGSRGIPILALGDVLTVVNRSLERAMQSGNSSSGR